MSVKNTKKIIESSGVTRYATICEKFKQEYGKPAKGDYGSVFPITKTKVVKIYKNHDLAYRAYIQMAQLQPSLHFPAVFERGTQEQFSWVIMERLDPFNSLTDYGYNVEEVLANIHETVQNVEWDAKLLQGYAPSLVNAVGYIHTIAATNICTSDVRGANVAIRQKEIIFLDPLCNTNNYHKNATPKKST